MRIITVCLVYISCSICLAQKKNEVKKENIFVHRSDTVIQTSLAAAAKKITTNTNRKYYWYRQGSIYASFGGYDGRLLNGPYKKFHPKGGLLEQGTFKYGLKHGKWSEWKLEGNVLSVTYWRKGKILTKKENFFEKSYRGAKGLFHKKKKKEKPSVSPENKQPGVTKPLVAVPATVDTTSQRKKASVVAPVVPEKKKTGPSTPKNNVMPQDTTRKK